MDNRYPIRQSRRAAHDLSYAPVSSAAMHREIRLHNTYTRPRSLRRQHQMIIVLGIFVLSAGLFLCTGIRAFARSHYSNPVTHTYYTSVQVESGDTLWDYARYYTAGTDISASDYMTEVLRLNHMSDENLQCGEFIILPYYR